MLLCGGKAREGKGSRWEPLTVFLMFGICVFVVALFCNRRKKDEPTKRDRRVFAFIGGNDRNAFLSR